MPSTRVTQESVAVTLAYGIETTYGTQSVAAGKMMPRTSSSLVLAKNSFRAQQVRSDQEVADARHGMRRVTGQVNSELMIQAHDDWMEALLRGTWAATTPIGPPEATSIAADNTTSKFTLTTGDGLALGLKVHDVIRLTNVAAANVGVNFRITAIGGASNREITVSPAPTTMAADTSFGLEVVGKKLTTGLVKRSFSIEQRMPDQDVSEMFLGSRIAQGSFRLPPEGMATVTYDIMGQDATILTGSGSPGFVSPAAEPVTAFLTGLNGALIFEGEEVGNVTGLDFTFTDNVTQAPVIGRNISPNAFYGIKLATGNVSAYIEDETLLQVFQNEVEVDLIAVLEAAGTPPVDFLAFRFARVKLMGITRDVGADGGVIAQFPFQALLKAGGAGTVYDQSSMVIQRSNA